MRHKIRFTPQKLQKRLELIESLVYCEKQALPSFECMELKHPIQDPSRYLSTNHGSWSRIEPGDHWLGPDTTFLLKSNFLAAGSLQISGPTALFLPIGIAGDFSHPEALVYVDGEPIAACDRHHQEVLLPENLIDGRNHELQLYGWTGGTRQPPDNRLKMSRCYLVNIHQELREFASLARVTLGIAEQLHDDNPIKYGLLNALDEAFLFLDTRSPIGEGFYNSVAKALIRLRNHLRRTGPPHLARISAVGHAHIDLAWLWTISETKRKACRTFTNVLNLMAEDSGFIFTQSQPQLYDWVRVDFPELFSTIKDYVDQGRWEPIGGMWVEADCNLTGSESLVRQLLLGLTFFEEEFGTGAASPVLWLPDVFGYAANLPQLM